MLPSIDPDSSAPSMLDARSSCRKGPCEAGRPLSGAPSGLGLDGYAWNSLMKSPLSLNMESEREAGESMASVCAGVREPSKPMTNPSSCARRSACPLRWEGPAVGNGCSVVCCIILPKLEGSTPLMPTKGSRIAAPPACAPCARPCELCPRRSTVDSTPSSSADPAGVEWVDTAWISMSIGTGPWSDCSRGDDDVPLSPPLGRVCRGWEPVGAITGGLRIREPELRRTRFKDRTCDGELGGEETE